MQWFEWGLDIVVCNLHHNVAVTHMPHMVVEIEVPCKAVDNEHPGYEATTVIVWSLYKV